jgi:hypothetical protein
MSAAAPATATATATATVVPLLPPVFKHEHPIANPSKGVFGTLARTLGATSNNRLILKPTQLSHERYAELGYDGVFGRYYRLAQSHIDGEKDGFYPAVRTAFKIVGGIRVLFFENLKRALRGEKLLPIDFRRAYESVRVLPELPESLRSELLVFLDILDMRYDIEMSNVRRSLREAIKRGGTRRKSRLSRRKYTRRN